jgi:ribosomal protein S12 methylthiotransferase accessory factor
MPDLTEALDRGKGLIDPVFGIIKHLYPVEGLPADPLLFNFATEVTDTLRFSGYPNFQSNGGAGLSYDEAQMSAVGESIERYASSFYSKDDFAFASFAELKAAGRSALDPAQVPLFSAVQYAQAGFNYRPFARESKTYWVEGFSLFSHQPVLVPAAMVYVPYFYEERENPFYLSSSSGLAFHSQREEAVLSGLYELIERDAVMQMWVYRQSRPKINLQTLPENLRNILQHSFHHSLGQIEIMDITSDVGVPVFFAALVGAQPRLAVGAACRNDPAAALLKALVEAAQTKLWARYLAQRYRDYKFKEDFSDIESFDQHVLLYARAESFPMFEFVLASQEIKDLSSVPACGGVSTSCGAGLSGYSNVLAQLKRAGIGEALYVDITPPEIRDRGFWVTKAIVPGLVPLGVGVNGTCLGHPRLSSAVNFAPHPFP